jgi:hypothetical protein
MTTKPETALGISPRMSLAQATLGSGQPRVHHMRLAPSPSGGPDECVSLRSDDVEDSSPCGVVVHCWDAKDLPTVPSTYPRWIQATGHPAANHAPDPAPMGPVGQTHSIEHVRCR